ncbi:hypothetical protein BCR43DRAFT_210215 [Syncephalastrum racemosum]|uniref:TPR-like protein n=1 Tax=Syncephalastrum racemosum TaxID=13706 RepID=A0A1X2HIN9_SYNRA|nr:hypothetical protein BCR43DRAFT_210215 [Syncephalastrum racemosum]
MQLHTAYEQMIGLIVQFPKAGETNAALLQFIEQLATDMSLIEPTHSHLRGYIEVLNRATQRSFNSPCITRHLFLALHALGDYDEAKHALSTYLYLVGLSSQAWEDAAQDGEALVVEPLTRKRVAIPRVSEIERLVAESAPGSEGDTKSIASRRSTENESIDSMVTVLLTAVTMYAESLQDGVKAVEVAELARCKLSHLPPEMQTADGLNVRILRHAGAAYNVLASQTHDISLRSSYHDKALDYLKTAHALGEDDWQTLYQLSLQYAETRDIQNAIPVVAKALQANPKHLPSWHLLTLLCSCPGQNDLHRALRTCELGLREAQDISQDTTEQHVLLKITQSLLLDATQGPEAALASHQALFALFGNLATPEGSSSASSLEHDPRRNQMVVSGSLGNLSEYQADGRRGRGSSIGNGSAPHVNESHILASRSHDDVRSKSRTGTLTNRTRSVSSFNKRAAPASNSMLSVPDQRAPDALSVKELSPHSGKHHHHGLHIFSSRSTSRRSRRDESQEWNEKNSASKNSFSPDTMSMHTSASSMYSFSRSSTRSLLEPSVIPTRPTARARMRQRKEARLLSDLWLLSASTFLKINKTEEARKAIEEAENADWTSNPNVWCTLGRLRMMENNAAGAVKAFHKGLVVDVNDIACRIWMAKAYLQQKETELAEGLLESVTKQNGWDSSEAWFYLGEMYKASGRTHRSKECLLYALELENTRPVQPFSILPRFA